MSTAQATHSIARSHSHTSALLQAARVALLFGLSATWAQAVTIVEYPVVDASNNAHGPAGITSGPDGNLWFTASSGNSIGKITPSGVPTLFALPGPAALGIFNTSLAITRGPDNNLWFTTIQNQIGRSTTTGAITTFQIPTELAGAVGITPAPDGNLWFAEASGKNIGRITPTGDIHEFPIPPINGNPAINATPAGGITAGPDGNLWFTQTSFEQCGIDFCEKLQGMIGKITTAGVVTEFPLSTTNISPGGITQGADGNLWFTENQISNIAPFRTSGGKIGRITPAGAITEFAIPTSNAGPQGITAGPDGNIWFTEVIANQIGKITAAGAVSEFPIPSADSRPVSITTGADGNLWFTESVGSKIGKLSLSTAPISIDGYLSGNWYDRDQSGQGFQLEMITGNVMVAIWFTFAPDGSGQNWIYAQGSYDNTKNTVTLPAMLVTGGKFPPNFKANDVTKTPWGTITFTFTDCNNAVASWNSTLPGYGSGTLPIARLTKIQGSSCP